MFIIDCTDCFTRVEFSENTVKTDYKNIGKVLNDNKDSIVMFCVDDYMFSFMEYITEGDMCTSVCGKVDGKHQAIGKYITPISHMVYMMEEEVWFRISEVSIDKFTFFMEDEIVIDIHGMLFSGGEFKENLVHRFSLPQIKSLDKDVCDYVMKNYMGEDKKPTNIWTPFKCVGIYVTARAKNQSNIVMEENL